MKRLPWLVIGVLVGVAVWAEPERDCTLCPFGDLRLRLEEDWASHRSDGTLRKDRLRLRTRVRLGARWEASRRTRVELRARVGAAEAQQSPHVTLEDFQGNPRGAADLVLDRWQIEVRGEHGRWSVGRQAFPFWRPTEMTWDDDVTPAGVSYRQIVAGGAGSLRLGYAALPDGMRDFDGTLLGAQYVDTRKLGELRFISAGGLMALRGDHPAKHLRHGDGERDYTLFTASLRIDARLAGRAVTGGVELIRNLERYDDPADSFGMAFGDQRSGLVLFIDYGSLVKGAWLFGWRYAHIEALAVNASFAQDDWVRWGSATQVDASDLEGHELRVGRGTGRRSNLLLRVFTVDSVTSGQDGNRARLDLNYRF
ncbi:hypothetical protein ABI59_23450 [Acidobacteria bacterium Mor1]|nr:hypothetical protein ABI59_23450 [Acidobacteria bacterium Mor1]